MSTVDPYNEPLKNTGNSGNNSESGSGLFWGIRVFGVIWTISGLFCVFSTDAAFYFGAIPPGGYKYCWSLLLIHINQSWQPTRWFTISRSSTRKPRIVQTCMMMSAGKVLTTGRCTCGLLRGRYFLLPWCVGPTLPIFINGGMGLALVCWGCKIWFRQCANSSFLNKNLENYNLSFVCIKYTGAIATYILKIYMHVEILVV